MAARLRCSVIHGDGNDANILVDPVTDTVRRICPMLATLMQINNIIISAGGRHPGLGRLHLLVHNQ